MTMQHKDVGLQVKSVSDAGVVVGYGSTFGGEPDSYGDIIEKGAFADSLAEHRKNGTMPLMLWGHNASDVPIGDWTEAKEDDRGLYLEGKIDLEDPLGARVHRAMKRGSVKGLSIGFDVKSKRFDEDKPGIRFLEKLGLWEVSPVNFPANTNAQLVSVKNIRADGLPSLPEFERFLREAGFSKSEATAITSKGLTHLLRSESGSDTDEIPVDMDAFWAHMVDAEIVDQTGPGDPLFEDIPVFQGD